MKLTIKDANKSARVDLLALLVTAGSDVVVPAGVDVPDGFVAKFEAKARSTRSSYTSGGSAREVLLIGLGDAEGVDAESIRRAVAVAVKEANKRKVTSVHIEVSGVATEAAGGGEIAGCAAAEGARMASYEFLSSKSGKVAKDMGSSLKQVHLGGSGSQFKKGAKRGEILAAANMFTRDLQNGAGNLITPTALAKAAQGIAKNSPQITIKVLDEAAMKKLGMGLLLGCSAGSVEPAKLIHLTYKPKTKSKGKIAFVGKGLTFDAGGYSLKPAPKMDEMRYDMSGGAAVLGAMHALSQMDVPFEVHGIVPSSENLIDGNATKPGDIHEAMNGTTVEILNTDAEGRLILADALNYVESKVKPDTIIDLATLTGAVIVGLGHDVTGMFASTTELRDLLTAAGETSGEPVWPLPLLESHKEGMKGKSADLANIGSPAMGAGASQGAAFLSHFVSEDRAWAHLDIAGTAWNTRDRDWVGGSQGSGVGARLLVEYLLQRAASC
ncbi:MAG: leucyl aminopeptidase [Planctomycetota bacterium]|jgi:leucyl aminopeptidase